MSGVTALAKPRRIKASHRRRRKVASDHLLYILNNPLSGTDPTGYMGDCPPRVQVCALSQNKLNALQAEVQSMAKGGMSTSDLAGKKFNYALNQVAKKGEKYNGASSGLTVQGAEGRKNQAAPAEEKNAATNSRYAANSEGAQESATDSLTKRNPSLRVYAKGKAAPGNQELTSDKTYAGIGDVRKVGAAIDVVKRTCPVEYGCVVPNRFSIMPLGDSVLGYTDSRSKDVVINGNLLDFSVDQFNPFHLLSTIYHESMHRGQSYLSRVFGGLGDRVNWLTPAHQLIYDRSHDLTVKNIGLYFRRLDEMEDSDRRKYENE